MVFVKQEAEIENLSQKLKKRIYLFLKESSIEDELKKNNVSLQEFEEVLFFWR